MLKLNSVRLVNFRLVKDSTFTPPEAGITGIFGNNGSGKSSFLDGALWALYGVLPPQVPASGIRRQGAAANEECFVEVEFTHNRDKIVVTRSIKGKSNTAILYTYVNGEENTGPSVKVSQKWINERLGIDAQGFMTAFVVPQKDLDTLITATPAARRALIEKLSGVDKMSQALKFAREDLNSDKRVSDTLPGSKELVKAAQEVVDNKKSHITDLSNEISDLRNQVLPHFEAIQLYSEKIAEIEDQIDSFEKLSTEKTNLEYRLSVLNSNLKETLAELSEFNEVVDLDGVTQKLDDINNELALVNQKINEHDNTVTEYNTLETRREERLNSLAQEIATLKNEKSSTSKELEDSKNINEPTLREGIDEDINIASEEIEQLNKLISAAQARIDDASESLAIIGNQEHRNCPTCLQKISDASKIIETLKALVGDQERIVSESRLKVEELNAKLVEYSAEQKNFQIEYQTYQQKINHISQLETSLNSINNRLTEKEDAQNQIKAWVNPHVTTIDREECEKQKSVLAEKREEFLLLKNRIDTYGKLKNRETEINTQIAEVNKNIESVVNQPAYNVNVEHLSNELNEVIALNDDETRKVDNIEATINLKTTECAVLQESMNSATRDLEREKSALEHKEAFFSLIEVKSGTVELLDEFRKAQIARIAPELADSATGLISEMTNGRYVEVTLDENFTPTVTSAEGETRTAYALSGGEMSVIALALRLAIGDLITGGNGGLLWLDEVLTAQDAERRSSLVETIRAMSNNGRQVVMINHTQESGDIVDHSVKMVRYGNYSQMETMS